MYVHMNVCTYECKYIYMYVDMYICICVYVYVCVCVCVYILRYRDRERNIQTAGNTKTMHGLYHFTNGLASNEGQKLARFKWTGIFFEYYENIVKTL